MHPAVIRSYLDGSLFRIGTEPSVPSPSLAALRRGEERVLRFLQQVAAIGQDENLERLDLRATLRPPSETLLCLLPKYNPT